MAIFFHSEDVIIPKIPRNKIKSLVKEILTSSKLITGDINFIFCSDQYLLKINQQYLNHNDFTDIITFPYISNNLVSGDIYISLDRIKENAGIFNEPLIREICRVVFHGTLHLTGLNDLSEQEKVSIREAENFWLNRL